MLEECLRAAGESRRGRAHHPSASVGSAEEHWARGVNALLLIPLKLRDGAHALSGFPLPLASILLASKPKKARPPRLGAGRERRRKTLRDLGDARSKSREVGEERGVPRPLFIAASGAKLQACRRANAWTARDGAAPHERKIPSDTVLRHDGTKQS